jgi:nicotinate-nucleotide adenylyltransferase
MKTGLFFGSFNPIHLGHLSIAQYILNETDIQKIKFIVSPHNPLKDKDSLMDAELRLDLLRLSIADNVHFEVSDIEFTLPTPSYTFQTLEALKAHPSKHCIIMGTDALERLPEWKEVEPKEIAPDSNVIESRFGELPGLSRTFARCGTFGNQVCIASTSFLGSDTPVQT